MKAYYAKDSGYMKEGIPLEEIPEKFVASPQIEGNKISSAEVAYDGKEYYLVSEQKTDVISHSSEAVLLLWKCSGRFQIGHVKGKSRYLGNLLPPADDHPLFVRGCEESTRFLVILEPNDAVRVINLEETGANKVLEYKQLQK